MKKIKIYFGIAINSITYFLYIRSRRKGHFHFLYFIQKRLLALIPLTPYELINHRFYAESHHSSTITTLIENRIGYTSNLIFGMESDNFSLMPIELPDIYLAAHTNVRIQGNSNVVIDIVDNLAINDFGYNMSNRYENIDGIIYRQKGNLSILKYDGKHCDRIKESGIMITGNFCQNYYHQMYEILIKFMILDKAQIPDDIPLIVDEIIFNIKSFKELFDRLNRTNRQIEVIGAKEIVEFGKLYCFSSVNIIPPSIKSINDTLATDIVFDITIIKKMREYLLEVISDRHFPKKIFISRKNSINRQYNEDEVISLVKENGFSVVAPEEYNLFEQIALFNSANCIIGATGAAFTNILFCHEGCKIICIQSRRVNISAFTTIAYSLGLDMKYCLGKPYSSELHSSFQVDLEILKQMMNNLIK